MADTKISALAAVTTVVGAQEFPVNDAGTTKKATATQLSTFLRDTETFVRVVAREVTLVNIFSSVTETDIFNQTIAANLMGTNRALRLTILYDRLNNSGLAETASIFRVYTGGTVRYQDTSFALATATARLPGQCVLFFGMQNSATVMTLNGLLVLGTAGGATTGIGNKATDEITENVPMASAGTFTQDTTAAWALRVTIQLGTSSALVDFRRQYAVLELL